MSFLSQVVTDLDVFMADMGEAQVWTPAGGAAVPFTGIADVGFALIDTVAGGVVSSDARVIGKTSVIGAAKQGDSITLTSVLNGISAAAYKVAIPQKDDPSCGPGFTILALKKA